MTTSTAPLKRLWCAVAFGYLAFGATLQVLPRWVPEQLGGGPIAVGVAIGIAFAATAAARPFAGRSGDAGLARQVVAMGGVLIVLGAGGQLLAPDLAVLLLARLVMGVGEAALFSAALPWVLDGVPAERRASVSGWFGLSMWGGLALGPLLTTAVIGLAETADAWWAIIASGMLSAGFALSAPRSRQPRRARLRPASWREVLPRGAGVPGLVFGLGAYGYGTISSGLVLFMTERNMGGVGAGLAVFAASFLVGRFFGSPLVDRWGGPRTSAATSVVTMAGFVVLMFAPNAFVTLLGSGVVGLGVSLALPATVLTTLARTEAGVGNAVATATSFWDLGILVAGPVTGVLAATTTFTAVFAVAGCAAAAAVVVSVALDRVAREPRAEQQALTRNRSRGPA